jgi:hypothetical protein
LKRSSFTPQPGESRMPLFKIRFVTLWESVKQHACELLDTSVTTNVRIVLIFSALMFVAGVAGTYSFYQGALSETRAEFKEKLGEKELRHVLFASDSPEPIFSEELRIKTELVGNTKSLGGTMFPVYDVTLYGPDIMETIGGRRTVSHVKFKWRVAITDERVEQEMLDWSLPVPTAEPGSKTLLYVVNKAIEEVAPTQPSYDPQTLQASR